MPYQQTFAVCPQCGNPLFEDINTGKLSCLDCLYDSGIVVIHDPDKPEK